MLYRLGWQPEDTRAAASWIEFMATPSRVPGTTLFRSLVNVGGQRNRALRTSSSYLCAAFDSEDFPSSANCSPWLCSAACFSTFEIRISREESASGSQSCERKQSFL